MAQTSGIGDFTSIKNAQPDENGIIELVALPLHKQVVFPGVISALTIASAIGQEAATYAQQTRVTLLGITPKEMITGRLELKHLAPIGTELAIGPCTTSADGQTLFSLVEGRRRLKPVEIIQQAPFWVIKASIASETIVDADKASALQQAVLDLFSHHADLSDELNPEIIEHIKAIQNPARLTDTIAAMLPLSFEEQQALLEAKTVDERLEQLAMALGKLVNELEIRKEFNNRLQQEMVRSQREVYLREQMRLIQSELGEGDIFQQEINELYERITNTELPENVRKQATKEVARLAMMPPMAPEVSIIRTYLDWLLDLPWHTFTEDNLDIQHVQSVLDTDHYGLPKVKERILEHIAVRKLAGERMKSPILCFVGPPGVGKTSMGRSIARALGRKFVRISLGGIRDESEIRGHRRTYVGALPGRIIQAIRQAGTTNPVFMLDEIDKLGMDFRGDPSAALLEVLDPEQNNAFSDHYLEIPFDLSKVMFIATANDLDTLSAALEDRLEVIEFSGYTEEEKIEIARRHLIPKQIAAHGLDKRGVTFIEAVLKKMIQEYTYEGGVRNLEREIANVCRKIARQVAEGIKYTKRITPKKVETFLGPPYFLPNRVNRENSIGIATGLVWTTGGGDIQTIEISLVPGKGNLTLTGQLGDVLQESAQAAYSYMRTRANDFDVPHDDFENYDIHIHMPEGAVPKDGPSAGITLAAAIISAFTERPIRSDWAMTGEITLRGLVLPVGGIKEKVLAARRNHIKNVILPADNRKEQVDIPKEALDDMNILFVDNMQQVIDTVLEDAPEERQRDREARERQMNEAAEDGTAGVEEGAADS